MSEVRRDGSEDHLVGEKNGLSLSEVKLNAKLSRNFALKFYSIYKISSFSENELKERLNAVRFDRKTKFIPKSKYI